MLDKITYRLDNAGGLNRAQRRALLRNAPKVDEITEADRRYFERFPHRQHRLRPASMAEVSDYETMARGLKPVPPGYRYHVVIRNVVPGIRLRVYLLWPASAETEISEDLARQVFEAHASEDIRRLADVVRDVVEKRVRP